MRFQSKLTITLLSVVALAVVGCKKSGPSNIDLVPAEGVVTLDGEPLAGATISMSNSQGQSTATSDASGKFKMQTSQGPKAYDGVPVGELKVAVRKNEELPPIDIKEPGEGASEEERMKYEEEMMKAQEAQGEPKSLIPEKYNDPTKSELGFTIGKEGKKDIKLELTSK